MQGSPHSSDDIIIPATCPDVRDMDMEIEDELCVSPKKRAAGKSPAYYVSEELSDEDEMDPNLETYFDSFGTAQKDRISICRTYASYLAALAKAVPNGPPTSPRKKKAKVLG